MAMKDKKPNGSSAVEKEHSIEEVKLALAKTVQESMERYTKLLVGLRDRELSKSAPAAAPLVPVAAAPVAPPAVAPAADMCPLCNKPDMPGSCACLPVAAAGMLKDEMNPSMSGSPSLEMSENGVEKAELCKSCGKAMDLCKCMGKAEIKDKEGKPVTCGKCAAFGTNSKGPGAHAPGCPNDTKKSEDFIDLKNANEHRETPYEAGPRLKSIPGKDSGVLPTDKDATEVPAEGSGGQIKKGKKGKKEDDKVEKADVPMAKPPSGKDPGTHTPVASNTSKPGISAGAGMAKALGVLPVAKPAAPAMPPQATGAAKVAAVAQQPIVATSMKPAGAPKLPGMGMAKPPVATALTNPKVAPLAPATGPKLPGMGVPAPKKGLMGALGKSELGTCLLCNKGEHSGKCE